jgi:acyl dehydratase
MASANRKSLERLPGDLLILVGSQLGNCLECNMIFGDRFQVGASATTTVPISLAMVDAFTDLSGDDAPLHTNEDFAKRHGFEGCLVHGALVVALLSRVVGTRFPGPRSLWLKCDVNFSSPCYAPSVLRFHGVITQQTEATRSLILTFKITDERNRQIAAAKTMHRVLEP